MDCICDICGDYSKYLDVHELTVGDRVRSMRVGNWRESMESGWGDSTTASKHCRRVSSQFGKHPTGDEILSRKCNIYIRNPLIYVDIGATRVSSSVERNCIFNGSPNGSE